MRSQWQAARVAQINMVRGLLREQGLPIPLGASTVLKRVAGILDDAETALPELLRSAVRVLVEEIRALEARIARIDQQLADVARINAVAVRLQRNEDFHYMPGGAVAA